MEGGTTTTKTTVINVIKVLFIGALVAISTGALFEVDRYEYANNINSLEYKEYKKKYNPINKERRKKQFENRLKFQTLITNGNFSSEQKVELQNILNTSLSIQDTSNQKLNHYNKGKLALQQSYKFRGWNGYYYFRLAINPYLMSFAMGLLLLYIIFNPIGEKWKKLVFSLFTGVFLFSSTYFILQAFFSKQVFDGDFPENWYSNLMTFIPIAVALLLPLLFYHYQTIETKLRNYVKSIFTYIYNTTDDIKQEKQKEHQLKRGELINKGLKIDG